MTAQTPQPAPGWYPDPSGTTRWWDGQRWTDATQLTYAPLVQPGGGYGPVELPKVAPGTKSSTLWIWLIVALEVLAYVPVIFTFGQLQHWMTELFQSIPMDGSVPDSSGIFRQEMGLFTSPWYLVSGLLGWVVYGVSVWFAYLDHRELHRRGFVKPFHWAWMFLSIVYVIGRAVVIRRRGSSGFTPMWVYIGVQVVFFIGYFIWISVVMSQLFDTISTQLPNA